MSKAKTHEDLNAVQKEIMKKVHEECIYDESEGKPDYNARHSKRTMSNFVVVLTTVRTTLHN